MQKGRRRFLLGAVAALAAVGPSNARTAGKKPKVVVELFTSQGCNSCPPAERYLAELAKRDDVLALEFHVDYWDYIGWKDPFADPRFTQRQQEYNQIFGSPYNYTPQVVIDGRVHEVGSRTSSVDSRIEAAAMKHMMAAGTGGPQIAVAAASGGGITVTLDGVPQESGAYDVLLIGFDGRHETEVSRGENTGKRLVNAHVVRKMERIARSWRGGPLAIDVSAAQLAGDKGCAILVQDPATGVIAIAEQMAY